PSSRAYRGRFRSAGDRRRRSRAEGEVARRRLACSHREPEAEAGAQSNGRLEALRFGSDQEGIQRKLQTNSDRSPGKPFRRGHGSDDESRSASLLDQGRMRALAEEDETALQSHSEGEGTCVEGMREEAEDRRLFRLDRQAEILGLRA